MGFGTNFADSVYVDGSNLTVSGSTDSYPEGELITRYVGLEQNHRSIGAPGTLDPGDWSCTIPLPAYGFQHGEVSANGIEVYYFGGPLSPGRPPLFLTFTWSQILTITPATGRFAVAEE